MKGFAREVDWDARVKRRQQEDLGVEDEQQPQVISSIYLTRSMAQHLFYESIVLFLPRHEACSGTFIVDAPFSRKS